MSNAKVSASRRRLLGAVSRQSVLPPQKPCFLQLCVLAAFFSKPSKTQVIPPTTARGGPYYMPSPPNLGLIFFRLAPC